jgi:hypothetical protein
MSSLYPVWSLLTAPEWLGAEECEGSKAGSYPSHGRPVEVHRLQNGLASS